MPKANQDYKGKKIPIKYNLQPHVSLDGPNRGKVLLNHLADLEESKLNLKKQN